MSEQKNWEMSRHLSVFCAAGWAKRIKERTRKSRKQIAAGAAEDRLHPDRLRRQLPYRHPGYSCDLRSYERRRLLRLRPSPYEQSVEAQHRRRLQKTEKTEPVRGYICIMEKTGRCAKHLPVWFQEQSPQEGQQAGGHFLAIGFIARQGLF